MLKDCEADILLQAIRTVVTGRRYLCPQLAARAIDVYVESVRDTVVDQYESLTTRERAVFQLIVEGHTNAQIAKRLFISLRTVETHRASLRRKLGLRTHAALVSYALRRGILSSESA